MYYMLGMFSFCAKWHARIQVCNFSGKLYAFFNGFPTQEIIIQSGFKQ